MNDQDLTKAKEDAAALRMRLIDALGPVMDLITEADPKGFVVNFNISVVGGAAKLDRLDLIKQLKL